MSFLTSDQSELGEESGKAARKYIKKELNGKAKVAILAFDSLFADISQKRVNGFLSELSDMPEVQVVVRQDAWTKKNAIKTTKQILREHKDIDLFFTANEGSTTGATLGVKISDNFLTTKVFGVDTSPEIVEFLTSNDNILQATTGQHPHEMGRKCIETASRAIRGHEVAPKTIISALALDRNNMERIEAFKSMLDNIQN